MSDLIKLARSRTAVIQTHWDGCERDHAECLIQRLADELERTRDNLKAIEDEKNAYIDYVGDALGQDEDGETLWDAAQRVLSERDRLRADLLTKDDENMALLAANRDCMDHFNALKADYDAARTEIERLQARCAELETALLHESTVKGRVAELEKDAARYRWLRGDSCPEHSPRWTQWEVRCWKSPRWSDDLRRAELDAAIDAARREK